MNTIISNGILTASIKHHGAELSSLKDKNGREYMWQADPAHWGKHSPVLFPVVGRLKDDSYRYQDKEYRMTRHGFARDHKFVIDEQNQDCVTFTLEHNETTLQQYPFPFKLSLAYKLSNKRLDLLYIIENTGEETMPFSIGAHPAFALPAAFTDYSLRFQKDETLQRHLLENDLISSNTENIQTDSGILNLHYSLFEQDALVFKHLRSKYIDIASQDEPFLRVHLNNCPYLGIWTKNQAPFICIEPWQGHADTTDTNGKILDKAGIITLPAGAQFSWGFGIEIH